MFSVIRDANITRKASGKLRLKSVCKYWLLKGDCCLEWNTVNTIFPTERCPKKEISEKFHSEKEVKNDVVVHLYFHFSFLEIEKENYEYSLFQLQKFAH